MSRLSTDMLKRLCLRFFLTVFLVFSAGCVVELPTDTPSTLGQAGHLQSLDGLRIGVQALSDPEEIDQYFGTDLLSKRILPVLVVAENSNASSSFLLSDSDFMLGRDDNELLSLSAQTMSGASSAGPTLKSGGLVTALAGFAVPGLGFAGLPLALIGQKVAADDMEIQRNFSLKQFWTRTVTPNRQARGFVYFPLQDDTDLDGASMRIRALRLKDQTELEFEIPIEWKKP